MSRQIRPDANEAGIRNGYQHRPPSRNAQNPRPAEPARKNANNEETFPLRNGYGHFQIAGTVSKSQKWMATLLVSLPPCRNFNSRNPVPTSACGIFTLIWSNPAKSGCGPANSTCIT